MSLRKFTHESGGGLHCPQFTLPPLTELKCEATVTLTGVTHIVQPACSSLFVLVNLVAKDVNQNIFTLTHP